MRNTVYWNFKLEILLFAAVIVAAISCLFADWIPTEFLAQYLTESRVSGITNICAIAIGIYMTVVTVIATSVMGISKALLARKMDVQIFAKVIIGVAECIISIFIGTFIEASSSLYFAFYVGISACAMVSFFKFLVTIILLFRSNIQYIISNIDADEEFRSNVIIHLEEIENQTKKI